MEPVTLTTITVLAALGVGFGAGWGLKPDAGVKALEAQTEAIKELNTGNQALVDKVQEVSVEEAKRETAIADKLTDLPPPCVKDVGGDPMSPTCLLSQCWQFGQSTANRPECRKIEELVLERMACPETQSTGGQ